MDKVWQAAICKKKHNITSIFFFFYHAIPLHETSEREPVFSTAVGEPNEWMNEVKVVSKSKLQTHTYTATCICFCHWFLTPVIELIRSNVWPSKSGLSLWSDWAKEARLTLIDSQLPTLTAGFKKDLRTVWWRRKDRRVLSHKHLMTSELHIKLD